MDSLILMNSAQQAQMYHEISTAYLHIMWLGIGASCILLLLHFIGIKLKLNDNDSISCSKIHLWIMAGAELAIFIWMEIKLPNVGCPPWPLLAVIFSAIAALLLPNRTKS